jgi:hypothetical protein
MVEKDFKIGRIVKISGLEILFEISEADINKISIQWNIKDYLISIHKYIFSYLPNNKKIIARVTKIWDKEMFGDQSIYSKSDSKYLAEAHLIAIYDDYSSKLEYGINTFPIIGKDVFALTSAFYQKFLKSNSKYNIEIGNSFLDNTLKIYANPDILFGKHLGVFGNTGTGKSCTVASLIQGIKRRLITKDDNLIKTRPKIIILDSNKEYNAAFIDDEFKVKRINKSELNLPHYFLSYTEYYKLFKASQGVQAPVLKEAIDSLKDDEGKFALSELEEKIVEIIQEKANNNNYNYNQWYGWCSTMINRIQQIVEDERIIGIIDSEGNTVDDIFDENDDSEIILIEADFDRDELDIIMFLLSKLIYKKIITLRETNLLNILLVFEEAHRYINENDINDYSLGNFYIERLAREGRKFGIGIIISSQRPSELSKTVLSQCNSFIIHRITNKNDLEFINKTLSSGNTELLSIIPGLEKQYAVIIGEAFNYSDIIKISTTSPTPDSADPKVIESWLDE